MLTVGTPSLALGSVLSLEVAEGQRCSCHSSLGMVLLSDGEFWVCKIQLRENQPLVKGRSDRWWKATAEQPA